MSSDRHTVTVSTFVAEPPARVWAELLHPGARWMLGANIETDFQVGSPVTFEGHFFGRQFEDHGTVLAFERARLMHFTHFSPLSGLEDVPENYHDIRITLEAVDGGTRVEVVQENIASAERAGNAEHQWSQALSTLAHSDGVRRR
ncbi:Activator of Hsp90 ATPase 1 family protein [Xylanimonas cellulosilytica DSM 15894]|uniref:Activator of Hsp90 ATPase 1 family protein n=1 Tax=Xylanimonas cellulosilytica (strain DSM 15894 / JCM 12276 / CECT 5975 / KCTC 9989 / LMG 20990 / NBRC 107835 / XIL07) TaxID=446471 RepID=D1BTY8_XYLCX|nr:SRPBCC family protein [Xylanimonas cellulosilytica]ACZ29152.1 Activator of Hsp90 ATPase 1 family protein [Xylanimonas cellulosilytica DSM 15894]